MKVRTIIWGMIITAMAFTSHAQSDYFDIPVQYQIGGKPWSVFSADFDGDGQADIATVSYQTDSMTIMLNAGNGTFPTSVKYLTGNTPVYVHGADINGDSAIDLAVSNISDNTISLFINNGDGTFATQVTVAAGKDPTSVRLADLDNDTIPDLIVTNSQVTFPMVGDSISVMYGNGDGSFQARITFEVDEEPQETAAIDLNNDGFLDLATVNLMSHNISVLLNDSTGSFAPAVNYPSHFMPSSISAADLDGDGDIDLIAPNSDAYDRSTISVILNKGDGSFDTTIYVNTGGYPLRTFTSDLDHDNDIDIIVANWMTDSISILINKGDATFEDPIQYPAGDSPASIIASDLNGDTYDDLAVANRNSNDVLVYFNFGSASSVGDDTHSSGQIRFELSQNAPNPFNPNTIIKYNLKNRGPVNLTIYNLLGQQVTTLVDREQLAGPHRVLWNGTGTNGKTVAGGIYFYRLIVDKFDETRKMVLLK